jgi:hypothetical protein
MSIQIRWSNFIWKFPTWKIRESLVLLRCITMSMREMKKGAKALPTKSLTPYASESIPSLPNTAETFYQRWFFTPSTN